MSETLANMEKLGGIDYSTEEQWTGRRWIDGKKVYQCSEVITIPNIAAFTRTWVYGNKVISNVDTVINILGIVKSNDGTVWAASEYRNHDNHVYACFALAGNNKLAIIIHDAANFYSYAVVTIQYTKTT